MAKKKNISKDANLVACNQEHEMAGVLRAFKKVNNKENREKLKLICKGFKNNKTIKQKNRENF